MRDIVWGDLYYNGNTHNSHIRFYYQLLGRVQDLSISLPYHPSCYIEWKG